MDSVSANNSMVNWKCIVKEIYILRHLWRVLGHAELDGELVGVVAELGLGWTGHGVGGAAASGGLVAADDSNHQEPVPPPRWCCGHNMG